MNEDAGNLGLSKRKPAPLGRLEAGVAPSLGVCQAEGEVEQGARVRDSMFPGARLELELLSMEPGLPEQLSQTRGQGRRSGEL